MNHVLIFTLVLLTASISTANAQGAGEGEQAIRKTIADYVAAFNAKDAKRMLDS
jgi:hypothetical protein